MLRTNLCDSRLALLAAAALLSVVAACGDNNGAASCECGLPPEPVCDANGGALISFLPPATCESGECVYTQSSSPCEYGCFDGACSTTPPECDPNPCTEPPAPTCDGNVLVQSLIPGDCSEGPECRYDSQRVDCADDICFDGECRPRDCAFIVCDEPPSASCDGDVAVTYAALGVCDPQTTECEYAETREDCADAGGACVQGRCTDPCAGVLCNDAPPATCDGEVAVSYASVGVCDGGDCSYAETRVDCSEAGDTCEAGACVDPCVDASCVEPPLPTCSEDGRERIVFEAVGACDETDTCSYGELFRTDCTQDNLVCIDGACVDDPLCEDVDCSVPPTPTACEGAVAVTFGAGLCIAGECNYSRTTVDCAAADLLCSEGACVDRCAVDGCVTPPAPFCEGDAAVLYGTIGTCDPLDGCDYPTFVDNCSSRGLTCEDGECVDAACDCDEPPGPGYCDGSVRIAYVTPGFCEGDSCIYKEEVAEDCADSGNFCVLGECVPGCPDEPCNPPAPSCDGDTRVEFTRAGFCGEDDSCDFSSGEVRTDCRADGLACVEGECVDACEFLTCDVLPEPECDGDVALLPSFPSACLDSACEFTTTRLDCTLSGDVCFEGACVDPCIGIICDDPPADECIDGVAVEYRETGRCISGDCVYGTNDLDCEALGLTCQDALCVDPCVGIVCDDVPADGCDGDALVEYSGDGVCSGGDCVYFTESFVDCAEFGQVCEADMCVDPCAGLACDDPPDAVCVGDVAEIPAALGSCDAGVCSYEVADVDCSALGQACIAGRCEDDCTNIDCEERTGAGCEGTVAFTYSASSPTCVGGECFYDRIEQDCADAGLGCVAGACVAVPDLCTQLDCTQPDDFCDGAVSVRYSGDGVCDGGAQACDFSAVETRSTCAPGSSCVAGVCREAPARGDVLFSEIYADAPGSDADAGDWVELLNRSGRLVDLSGSVLTNAVGGRVVLPVGTTLADGEVLVVGASGGVVAPDVAVDFYAFSVPNSGTTLRLETEGQLIDEVDFDATFGIAVGQSIELLESARTGEAANDVPTAWCASATVFDAGSGATGTPGVAATGCVVP